jgi:SAM-dependent methyltransferase
MAHQQERNFCESVKKAFPHFFSGRLVLDIGSLDINGNNQYLFEDCLYLGVDLAEGRNVDITTPAHNLRLPDECVDVVISTECFEHDQFYALTLNNIVRMLKPGGLFLFSCATTGRAEHGTRRTKPEDSPFTLQLDRWADYYKNLEEGDIRLALNIEAIFANHAFSLDQENCDLYFWGIKKGVLLDRNDYSFRLHQSELDLLVAELRQTVTQREGEMATLSDSLLKRDAQISDLLRIVADRDTTIAKLMSSRSWRLTRPLRVIGQWLRRDS